MKYNFIFKNVHVSSFKWSENNLILTMLVKLIVEVLLVEYSANFTLVQFTHATFQPLDELTKIYGSGEIIIRYNGDTMCQIKDCISRCIRNL